MALITGGLNPEGILGFGVCTVSEMCSHHNRQMLQPSFTPIPPSFLALTFSLEPGFLE